MRGEGGGVRRRRSERDALESCWEREKERRKFGEIEWMEYWVGMMSTVRSRRAQFWDRWDQPQDSRHKRRSAGVCEPGERLLRAN